MAILTGAIVKIVTRHTTLRTDPDRGLCLHIAVSDAASLFNFFNTPGNATSHFYVRKTGNTNGMADFEQYVDTKYQAPAQRGGNPTLISIETQGGVGDDLNNGWTATQLERLAWIAAQCHLLHGVPLKLMPDSLPASTGIGYHRLGIDPWRVPGGESWSSSFGKVCPGDTRIAQVPGIIARAIQIAGEDMLTPEETAKLNKAAWLADQFAQGAQFETDLDGIGEIKTQVAALDTRIGNHEAAMQVKLDELLTAVNAREGEVAAGGRYGHIIDTLTQWAEERDNFRQAELLAKLAELHPPAPPPLA